MIILALFPHNIYHEHTTEAYRMSLSPEEEFAQREQEAEDAMSASRRASGSILPDGTTPLDNGGTEKSVHSNTNGV